MGDGGCMWKLQDEVEDVDQDLRWEFINGKCHPEIHPPTRSSYHKLRIQFDIGRFSTPALLHDRNDLFESLCASASLDYGSESWFWHRFDPFQEESGLCF